MKYSIKKNHAYEAGLVSKAYLNRSVMIAHKDRVMPHPGHGRPMSKMHGHEAPQIFNVMK